MKLPSLLIMAVLASCLICSTLMMSAVVGEERTTLTNSIIEITKPYSESSSMELKTTEEERRSIMEKQPEGLLIGKEMVSVASNSTQNPTVLFSGYSINSAYIAPYAWIYYYIDVRSNAKLTITHYTSHSSTGGLEIYIQDNYGMPYAYQYKDRQSITYASQTMTYTTSTYSTRVYIGVRNTLSISQLYSGYRFSVNIASLYTEPPKSETKTYYYSNNGTIISFFLPALLIALITLITLIVQIRRINQLNKRIADLESRMNQGMTNNNVEEMMPVMNMPLMAANSLEQTHQQQQEEQVETNQPQVVQQQQPQQPMYPQYIHPQGIPYPMRYYPQVVAFPQQPQMGQQVVAFPQQPQQQNTQTKQ